MDFRIFTHSESLSIERLENKTLMRGGFYLDGPFGLHEPAAQHRLDLTVCQLAVGRLDLPLHRLLQQQTPQTPVKELTGRLPFKDVLGKAKDKRNNKVLYFKCQHIRDCISIHELPQAIHRTSH